MTDLNKDAIEPRQSKLNRFRSHLSIRSPVIDKHQLKKPSGFFKGNSHTRQKSMDDIVKCTDKLEISSDKVTVLPAADTFDNVDDDINNTPTINQVSNFSSPSKSITSQDNILHSSSPTKPVQFILPTSIPNVNITSEDLAENVTQKASKRSRLRKKALSMFFDQGSISNDGADENMKKGFLVRPQLEESLSDEKKEKRKSLSGASIGEAHHIEFSVSPKSTQQHDLFRKRSRTLGSVENDLYHKRNGSLVKAIGIMVMPKTRTTTTESLVSTSDNSSHSDFDTVSDSVTKAPTPPKIHEEDTPETYLSKLIDQGFENELTSMLSDSNSDFYRSCLDHFMAVKFEFKDEALDLSLRKFLMVCDLPKEAQQIDRLLSSFSLRYYTCNESLWDNPDQVYFITFSLVMLHTDHFNIHNKKKMSREEFVKNTKVDDPNEKTNNSFLSKEIFEYFYDNVTYAKFIQKSKSSMPSLSQNQPIYSLPRRIFSSTSSTNIEGLNPLSVSQNISTAPINNRSQSISSTTSQFFNFSQVDPYTLMANDQIDSLKLAGEDVKDRNPFLNRLRDTFPESYYTKIRDSLLSSSGAYIRFNRDCNWLTGKTEIRSTISDPTSYSESTTEPQKRTCVLKIVKIAELFREETVRNSKFFTIGNSNKVIWKKCFGVLTTCGFFIFDNLNFLAISDRERILNGESVKEGDLFIFDILSDQILRSCSKLSINGLFACQSGSDDHHTFNVYSTNKKELYSAETFSEMSSWIIALNYVAALDSCYIEIASPYDHNEVVPLRNITMEDKVKKLTNNTEASVQKIQELVRLQRHLNNLVPFSSKTKDKLLAYYKSLMIRIDWLWYEVERNQVYIKILNRELQQRDDLSSLRTYDDESILEDSFMNDDSDSHNHLHRYSGRRQMLPIALLRNRKPNMHERIADEHWPDDEDEDEDGSEYVDSVESQ